MPADGQTMKSIPANSKATGWSIWALRLQYLGVHFRMFSIDYCGKCGGGCGDSELLLLLPQCREFVEVVVFFLLEVATRYLDHASISLSWHNHLFWICGHIFSFSFSVYMDPTYGCRDLQCNSGYRLVKWSKMLKWRITLEGGWEFSNTS